MNGPKNDLTGKFFGQVEVLRMEITERSHGNEYRAICKCHRCGREYDHRPALLKNLRSGSCGCDQSWHSKTTLSNSAQFRGHKDMGAGYVSSIRGRSKKKGWEFDLDAKFMWELLQKQNKKCALSGLPIKFSSSSRNRSSDGTASLDRIDSSKGYIKGNVQWVHKDINYMKNELNEAYFVKLCECVYKNKNDIFTDLITPTIMFKGGIVPTKIRMQKYKKQKKEMEKEMEVSVE